MGMFQRGFDASRAEKERQDKAREEMGKKLWRFFIKDDGDEADLRFLNAQPVNFREHNIKRGDRFENYTCTGENCPFCADGDRPTYKGAFLVIDRRPYEYTDKNGKKQKGKNQIRLFVMGMKVVAQLDRINTKYKGLNERDVTLVRLGKGTQTTYTIEVGEREPISKKEIESLLPEKLRDEYDGSQDSIMTMIENQLLMATKDYDPSDTPDEYEDEEEEKPKKSSFKSKLRKRGEESRKPRAKSLLRKEV